MTLIFFCQKKIFLNSLAIIPNFDDKSINRGIGQKDFQVEERTCLALDRGSFQVAP
jgi:hypothetical protein